MKVVIVGAGIGGLTTALAFRRIGWDVVVLEQAKVLGDVGAGIQISPNGVKVLSALGLTDALREVEFEPERLEMRLGKSGRHVFSIPLKEIALARWGASYLSFHRADLIATLRKMLELRAPGALRTGCAVKGYQQYPEHAAAVLEDGSEVQADLLVGADGLHSVVRQQMLGSDAPRFTGHVAWRATVPLDQVSSECASTNLCVWAGAGRHAVTYRIRGGTVVNFVGIVERDKTEIESWVHQGQKDDVLADFEGWHPAIRGLIEGADTHFCWALFDRAPLPQWSEDRVALLGDAAHPMLPSMAQGAVMAIEDAWTLVSLINDGEDISSSLTRYHQQRIARTTRVQKRALTNLRLFHQRTQLQQAFTYGPIWLAGVLAPGFLHARQDWIYGAEIANPLGRAD